MLLLAANREGGERAAGNNGRSEEEARAGHSPECSTSNNRFPIA